VARIIPRCPASYRLFPQFREEISNTQLAHYRARVELIVIDELGYVPLAEVAAELLFQVIAERAEKAAIIVTTNLPFSEWPQVFTNARLCKAVLDRLTDQAHIIETGSESYRFRRTLRKKRKE
jgi:DNA replication protein DnaC